MERGREAAREGKKGGEREKLKEEIGGYVMEGKRDEAASGGAM